jgi:hypothetical protein
MGEWQDQVERETPHEAQKGNGAVERILHAFSCVKGTWYQNVFFCFCQSLAMFVCIDKHERKYCLGAVGTCRIDVGVF